MPNKVGERCATCKHAKNPHTTKSAVVDIAAYIGLPPREVDAE